MKKLIVCLGLCCISLFTHANDEVLNETLVRIINQINEIMPLLDEAEDEVAPNARIRLHISSFEGSDGLQHPGLRDDLRSMRHALISYINKPLIEPKTIKPLAFDFVETHDDGK